jgi:hypothetical protein
MPKNVRARPSCLITLITVKRYAREYPHCSRKLAVALQEWAAQGFPPFRVQGKLLQSALNLTLQPIDLGEGGEAKANEAHDRLAKESKEGKLRPRARRTGAGTGSENQSVNNSSVCNSPILAQHLKDMKSSPLATAGKGCRAAARTPCLEKGSEPRTLFLGASNELAKTVRLNNKSKTGSCARQSDNFSVCNICMHILRCAAFAIE